MESIHNPLEGACSRLQVIGIGHFVVENEGPKGRPSPEVCHYNKEKIILDIYETNIIYISNNFTIKSFHFYWISAALLLRA